MPARQHFHRAFYALALAVMLFGLGGRCLADDFVDYPRSAELEAILVDYEDMQLENRTDELTVRIGDYVAANPDDPLGYYLFGLMAMDRYEFGDALTWFGTALGLAPDLSDAHAQSAMALLYSRQVDPAAAATATLTMAFEAVNRAVDISPRRPDLRMMQATVSLEAGDPWTAAAAMEAAVALAPGSVTYHIRLGSIFNQIQMPKRALEQFNLAYILNSQANPHALESRSTVIDTTGFPATSARHAAAEPVAGLEAVEQLRQKREFLQAAAKAGELAQQFPFDPDVLTLAAVTRVDAFNDVETAAAYLQRVVQSAPLHERAREALCATLRIQAENQDEPDHAQEAPDSAAPEFSWEQCMQQAADAQNAATLRDALFADPERVDWLRQVGGALVRLQRPDRALPYLQAAVYLAPDDPDCARDLEHARALALEALTPDAREP
jgi:tetratricopeptide (TPR) repeat protein